MARAERMRRSMDEKLRLADEDIRPLLRAVLEAEVALEEYLEARAGITLSGTERREMEEELVEDGWVDEAMGNSHGDGMCENAVHGELLELDDEEFLRVYRERFEEEDEEEGGEG